MACRHARDRLCDRYLVSLKKLLQQGDSDPEFYGKLVSKFKKFNEILTFLISLKNRFKKVGYDLYIMRQTVCLVLTHS